MNSPSRIGALAQDVLRHASLREGLTRDQRLQLGAATLLAFVQQAHEGDSLAVLQYAAELAGDRARDTADMALNALAEVGALLDADCDETQVALYNPRATVAAIRKVLEQAHDALRPTLPPYEVREHEQQ